MVNAWARPRSPGISEQLNPTTEHRLTFAGADVLATTRRLEALVCDHAYGLLDETPEELSSRPEWWRATLVRLLNELDEATDTARDLEANERALVLADLAAEREMILADLTTLVGPDHPLVAPPKPAPNQQSPGNTAEPELQLSWTAGRIVAWLGAADATPGDIDEIIAALEDLDVAGDVWESSEEVRLPGDVTAPAVSTPAVEVVGWLAGLRNDADGLAASAVWLSEIARAAVATVARGRMVPQLHKHRRKRGTKGERGTFSVRWVPALVSPDMLTRLGTVVPGPATVLHPGGDPRTFARDAHADLVHQLCASAAAMIEVPAAPPEVRTREDVAEAFLATLDGRPFEANTRTAGEIIRRLEQWGRSVTGTQRLPLVVALDEPDDIGAWYLRVLAKGPDDELEPAEVALVTGSNSRRKDVGDDLARLEHLVPALLRPGSQRRGEVVLSQDEAWELMSSTGPSLQAAGYEVRVPALSRKSPVASLRLSAEPSGDTVVSAQQLANVSWTATFDDVELDAAEIARLAAQARPLVRSRGRWVALDHADLNEAAAALAERADTTALTGAEMLRHALGLEGSPVSGGVALAGESWAANLLQSAAAIPSAPPTTPTGFVGELRSYQAEALAWLSFLDSAGLGGCLALDMGLGKTPTLLAHLASGEARGPSLVIAPPAVVGNWASEAERFTPGQRVAVHHGPSRASGERFRRVVDKADIILTTYGTAVRDVDLLENVEWGRVVLDEAQTIKNPASETAVQLRRLDATSRIALTGTPIENGLGDLWALLDFTNPGLVGPRAPFIEQLSATSAGSAAENALRALNGVLVFRRTKAEPAIAAELPDRIDELDHCAMTAEQIGLYQAVIDSLVVNDADPSSARKGQVLAAITALKQICNHPVAYEADDKPLSGRSGKLERLEEIVDTVFSAGERMLIFTHFATWGERLAAHLTDLTGTKVDCYHGGLSRGVRDRMIEEFQGGTGPGALVLSLKAGGTGLNLTAANHVVLYDRWWNPAVEDQARDRAWRIGQKNTVICHRLVCSGTVDERVEEVVAGKRQIADIVLPKSSSLGDLDAEQLRAALGLDHELLLTADADDDGDST